MGTVQVGTVRGEDWNFQFSGKIVEGILHFRLQMQYEGDDSEQVRWMLWSCTQIATSDQLRDESWLCRLQHGKDYPLLAAAGLWQKSETCACVQLEQRRCAKSPAQQLAALSRSGSSVCALSLRPLSLLLHACLQRQPVARHVQGPGAPPEGCQLLGRWARSARWSSRTTTARTRQTPWPWRSATSLR